VGSVCDFLKGCRDAQRRLAASLSAGGPSPFFLCEGKSVAGDWLKLHRQLLDSAVFANPDLLKMWVWCLCRASYKPQHVPMQTGRGATVVTIGPGQFIFGRNEAAKTLKMKPSTVASRLKKLQNLGNIDTQPGGHFTVVTINNWSSYQTDAAAETGQDCQATDKQLTGNCQPLGTYKKDNKDKKVKKTKAAKPPAFVVDLDAVNWPPHLKTTASRKALAAWSEYKQAQPHRWKTQQGAQGLVNSFQDYTADQFVTQINLALAHGSCKAPWLPANTFGKTAPRGGRVVHSDKLDAELARARRITAARHRVQQSSGAERQKYQAILDELINTPDEVPTA